MIHPFTLLLLSAVAFVFWCCYILARFFLSPLSRIPNAHITSPISCAWISRIRASGTETKSILALHQTLGPIVRLGPNELSVNSASGLRTIYGGGFPKHEWYHHAFLNYGTENLVSTLENRPHAVQKRMLSHVYSKSYLQRSRDLQTIAKVVLYDRLLPILQDAAQRARDTNVLELFHASGMDFTSAYLFGLGQSTNFLQDVEYRRHWLGLYSVFKNQDSEDRKGGEIETWCLAMCETTCATDTERKLRLDDGTPTTTPIVCGRLARNLPSITHDGKPKDLAIASEMLDHLIAGHETSAITLAYLLYELSLRPELQTQLRAELYTLSPPLLYPDPAAELPSARDIDALPFLDALIKETLRLYAAVPAPQPRVTPPGGSTIEGYRIPGGVKVSSSAYTLHRNAEVFPSPSQWLPERWLKGDNEGRSEAMRRWFWAFGSGGRMCIGSNFAVQEIKLITTAIYTNYTTSIVDAEDIEPMDAFIAAPKGGKLILRFKEMEDRKADLSTCGGDTKPKIL